MYHFFADPVDIGDNDICIRGEDYNHIKNVLRMRQGEELSVSDGILPREYLCRIADFGDDAVHCRIDSVRETESELPVRVLLFQSLPKSDKMELILQKSVELGIAELIPVRANRCVVKLDEKKAAAKTDRWKGIAVSAAKQSGRGILPAVHDVMDFKDAVTYAEKCDVKLIAYELAEGFGNTREVIEGIREGGSAAIFIGPEGGFEEEEIERAEAAGIVPITLGHRILRTETAALTILSWLIYRFER